MPRFACRWSVVCVFFASAVANAQFGREAVWMTGGRDAQRSSWVKSDLSITRDNLSPDFQFLWKVQLDSAGKRAPSEPIVMERYIGYRGFRSLAFMGDGGEGIYAVDTDLNRIEWQKHLTSADQVNCNAESASITLPTNTEFATSLGGGFGRGGYAKSGVGEPFDGAVTLVNAVTPPAAVRPPATPARPMPARTRAPIVIYSVTSDGMLHTMYVSNGEEPDPAVKFIPAGSRWHGLIVVNQVAYAVAGEKCGTPDEVVSLNLSTKAITTWKPDGAVIAGSEGAALGPDGTLYVGTGKGTSNYASSIVALDPVTLQPKDWYSVPGAEFNATPVIFQYKNKVFVAAASKDGRIHILDTKSLGGADHLTAIAKTETGGNAFETSALAVWQDTKLTHWLVASTKSGNDGSVTSWKLVDDEHGAPMLQTGWTSRNITSPSAPLVINGIVFAASGARDKPVIYGMDAATGQELWSSKASVGASIESLSGGGGHLFATTHEGALYAFGLPMEH